MKFPVFSLLARNFASETGSLETAPSSKESGANSAQVQPVSTARSALARAKRLWAIRRMAWPKDDAMFFPTQRPWG
jgi:hypothetical protein